MTITDYSPFSIFLIKLLTFITIFAEHKQNAPAKVNVVFIIYILMDRDTQQCG